MNHFFLVGSVRSGTTLLRLMLDHHPQLGCFGEFEYAVDPLTDPTAPPSGAEFANWLGSERRFAAMKLSADPSLDYHAIAHSLLDQLASRVDKPFVMTGMSVHRNFERLAAIWPHAKFIYLYRDGRDVARSCRQMGWAGHLHHAAGFWEAAEASWKTLRELVPAEQCYEICNESLVQNPSAELASLCDHLGVDFSEQMLHYHVDTNYQPPDPSRLWQWKRKLTRAELGVLEARIGEQLRLRGYEPSGVEAVPASASKRLWYEIQNRWGKHRFRIRRFGLSLWATELLARKLRLTRLERGSSARIRRIAVNHLQ
ncbi:MAG: sulfotransferase [Planctomycetota bacterium]